MSRRLQEIEAQFERLTAQLSDPNVVADQERFQSLAKQHADLTPLVDEVSASTRRSQRQIAARRGQLTPGKPGELRELAEEELRDLAERSEAAAAGAAAAAAAEGPE